MTDNHWLSMLLIMAGSGLTESGVCYVISKVDTQIIDNTTPVED